MGGKVKVVVSMLLELLFVANSAVICVFLLCISLSNSVVIFKMT